jgi:putative protein kinase ArgK-like GTPase of G3E family
VDHALDKLDLDDLDFLFIENVGNLVCPADFPLGTDQRMVVISVTEGDDMIRKQPGIFIEADIAVLNKIDLLPLMDVDTELMDRDYDRVKKGAKLYRTSAKTGEGLDELFRALNTRRETKLLLASPLTPARHVHEGPCGRRGRPRARHRFGSSCQRFDHLRGDEEPQPRHREAREGVQDHQGGPTSPR